MNEKAFKAKQPEGENVKNKTNKFEKINEALRLKKAKIDKTDENIRLKKNLDDFNKNKLGIISDEIDDDENESFSGTMEMTSVDMPMSKEEEYMYI